MSKAMPESPSDGSTAKRLSSDQSRDNSANSSPLPEKPERLFGAEMRAEGGVLFRLFAPAAANVRLAIDEFAPNAREPVAMRRSGDGWHELAVEDAGPGTRYRLVLPDGARVPDPASRYAPGGVHGSSEVIDSDAFQWSDSDWRGRPWNEVVLYELHIGTFTPEGTFRAAIERLDHLRKLGVSAIELMCICAFAGQRSWGYDGVQFYAPNSTYGRPEDLQAFIDAAHARGIMVILDVVYNHFGPEGNYIPKYFPQIFSESHKTAWGPGLNFDGPYSREVREFIVQNAVYWTREFHVDGLRLDASHAMIDTSPHHILNEIAERVHAAAGDRHVHLILEDEKNIAPLLQRGARGDAPYAAQWNHAVDHMLGLSMSGDCDPADASRRHETEELARALAEGFFNGDPSCPPGDRITVPMTAFVSFIQTHDLVGNRIFGERIDKLAPPEAVRAVAAIYLLLPQIPMLFMGEEWAATSRFPFFSDYGGELAEAVRLGRARQLAQIGQVDERTLSQAPDPQAESTFLSAKLHWEELNDPLHAAQLDWYQRVLSVRRDRILPLLDDLEACGSYQVRSGGQLECEWRIKNGDRLRLRANLCATPSNTFTPASLDEVVWLEGSQPEPHSLGAWSVLWSVEPEAATVVKR
jgi:maltooligosyltrehalose trehalohydrolase